jgi:hypothetical protein
MRMQTFNPIPKGYVASRRLRRGIRPARRLAKRPVAVASIWENYGGLSAVMRRAKVDPEFDAMIRAELGIRKTGGG